MGNEKNTNIYLKLVSNRDNYMSSLRDNVGLLRTEKKWSVRVLAEKANISEDTLNTFLKGTSKDCNLSTVVKLARALGVTIDELVGAGTMSDGTRECVSRCRVMPQHFVNLARSYIRHIYKLYEKTESKEPRLVILPECRRGHLQTTNVTAEIDVSHLPSNTIGRIAHGLMIPCDHYEPYFLKDEIILLAVDRDGQDGEMCVISHNGEYYIVRKKMYIKDGQKKWKYMSLFTEKEFLKEEIEDKLGYVVGFLNPDRSWGIR